MDALISRCDQNDREGYGVTRAEVDMISGDLGEMKLLVEQIRIEHMVKGSPSASECHRWEPTVVKHVLSQLWPVLAPAAYILIGQLLYHFVQRWRHHRKLCAELKSMEARQREHIKLLIGTLGKLMSQYQCTIPPYETFTEEWWIGLIAFAEKNNQPTRVQ